MKKSKKKIVANNKEQKTIKINLFICVFSSSLCYYIRQLINQKDNENTKKYNGKYNTKIKSQNVLTKVR